MTPKYLREEDLVKRLVQRLGLAVDGYEDPNASGGETGADVTVRCGSKRIGVQATILDTGAVPGQAIAREKAQARAAMSTHNGVYGGWVDPNPPIAAIVAAITRKSQTRIAGFDEAWLLVSASIPEHGAVISTSIPLNNLTAGELTEKTKELLSRSSYARAFLHPIMRFPHPITKTENVLYEWRRTWQKWEKYVRPHPE